MCPAEEGPASCKGHEKTTVPMVNKFVFHLQKMTSDGFTPNEQRKTSSQWRDEGRRMFTLSLQSAGHRLKLPLKNLQPGFDTSLYI